MKVLLVNKYHYIRGGSETYYFGLAELLRNAGHEVIFFAMEDARNLPCAQSPYFVSNVEFNGKQSVAAQLKAAARMVYSLEAKKKFSRLIKDEKPDVVHINLFHRVLTASIIDAAKKHGIPIILTMHDLNILCPNHTMLAHGEICEACLYGNYWHCVRRVCFKKSRLKCLMAAIESWYNKRSGLYGKINLIITPSAFYEGLLKESGIYNNRILHLKNFLPDDTQYGVNERGSYVLYYGRLSWEKGLMTLLRAMRQINAKLLIVGSGPMDEKIQSTIVDYHIENRVELAGFQTGEALRKSLHGASVVVIPSEWYEASGYTACEAQAAGKPVVVTSAGGLPENIIDGVTGIVCPMMDEDALAEALNRLLEMNDEDYQNMAQDAVINAHGLFDARQYADRIVWEYEKLTMGGT